MTMIAHRLALALVVVFAGSFASLADAATAKPLGRVVGTPSTAGGTICDRARSARARNSPAAPGLEQQCVATGAQPPAAAPAPAPRDTVGYDVLDRLEAQGKALIAGTPLAQETGGPPPMMRGFHIGIAAAGTDTAWGPGQQAIFNSLHPTEGPGFQTAMDYALERNANADLIERGAAIVAANAAVAEARLGASDTRERLGFDIGIALFSELGAGGLGIVPGSAGATAVRGSLSGNTQRGFDAAGRFAATGQAF